MSNTIWPFGRFGAPANAIGSGIQQRRFSPTVISWTHSPKPLSAVRFTGNIDGFPREMLLSWSVPSLVQDVYSTLMMSVSLGFSSLLPGVRTLEISPDGRFSASAGGDARSGGGAYTLRF